VITLAKIHIYRQFSGDLDGWARMKGKDNPSAIIDVDWRMIDDLRQALVLVASGRASPDFCRDTERRLTECTDNEATREALRSLATEDLSIRIREAFIDDAEVIARIIREANRDVAVRFGLNATNCPKHPSFCSAEWVKSDFARGERYFILTAGGRPVGCVAYEVPNAQVAYLNRLSVLPVWRRYGHGKRLVEHVIALARTAAIPSISVGVIGGHEDLQRWYRKQGFVDGEVKRFPHLPFSVKYMHYAVRQT
jgi:N-acetylglutamate synthase-like GNAT family acetyltransferase